MAGRSALVTGATGFLGQNLVDQLHARGWKITVLVHSTGTRIFDGLDGLQFVQGDLQDRARLTEAIPQGVDCVFHLAGDTSFWRPNNARQHTINVDGTRNLLKAAAAKQASKVIYTSTVGVYGASFSDVSESSAQRGRGSWISYINSKAEAEEVVRDEIRKGGVDVTIMNPCNIVGPHDKKNWARMFTMIENGSLPGVPPGSGVFCDARAVAKAHVDAFEKGRSGENYILGGASASMLEFVRVASEILGRKLPANATPAVVLKLFGRLALWGSYITRKEPEMTPELAAIVCGHQSIKTTKAEAELGYSSPDLEEMVGNAIAWMRGAGILKA